MDVYTVCVSGPASTQAKAEVALETARIPLLPSDHHETLWAAKVPTEDGHRVLVVQHPSVDAVADAVRDAGWVLRSHHHASEPPRLDPVTATLDEMRAEIAALKAKVGI